MDVGRGGGVVPQGKRPRPVQGGRYPVDVFQAPGDVRGRSERSFFYCVSVVKYTAAVNGKFGGGGDTVAAVLFAVFFSVFLLSLSFDYVGLRVNGSIIWFSWGRGQDRGAALWLLLLSLLLLSCVDSIN